MTSGVFDLLLPSSTSPGTDGIEDATVSKVELISEAPDGEYALEYYYLKPVYRRVRVKDGRLVAPESA